MSVVSAYLLLLYSRAGIKHLDLFAMPALPSNGIQWCQKRDRILILSSPSRSWFFVSPQKMYRKKCELFPWLCVYLRKKRRVITHQEVFCWGWSGLWPQCLLLKPNQSPSAVFEIMFSKAKKYYCPCSETLWFLIWILGLPVRFTSLGRNTKIQTNSMELCSDDEEIQCMELLEGNYQLFMNWPSSSASSSSAAVASSAAVGVAGGFNVGAFGGGGECCSASSSSSVNANLPGYHLYANMVADSPPPPPAPLVDVVPLSSPLAGNRFWHTIKSRPLIKTAIIR